MHKKDRNKKGHSLKPGPGPLKQGTLIKEPLNKGPLGCLVTYNVGSNGSTKDARTGARQCKLADRKGEARNE